MNSVPTEESQSDIACAENSLLSEFWQIEVTPSATLEFTRAFYDYKKSLGLYAFFKTNDLSLSEDLVQETFTKAWIHRNKKGEINNMKAFLRHILTHLIVDEYRKRKATSLDILLAEGFEPTNNDHNRICDVMDGENAILLIRRLPEQYHRIMHMRFVEDLSLEEMSQSMGVSKNAIAVQAHRGLQKLKAIFDHTTGE